MNDTDLNGIVSSDAEGDWEGQKKKKKNVKEERKKEGEVEKKDGDSGEFKEHDDIGPDRGQGVDGVKEGETDPDHGVPPADDKGGMNTEIEEIHAPSRPKAEEAVVSVRERKFTEEILNKHHGRYFEFNDSTVQAMPLKGLQRAFEGTDSAYILVYRRVEKKKRVKKPRGDEAVVSDIPNEIDDVTSASTPVPPTLEVEMGGLDLGLTLAVTDSESGLQEQPSSVPRSLLSNTFVPPPQYWNDKAILENKEMKENRLRYNSQSHNALIRFFCPAHVKFDDPLLLMTKLSQSKKGGKGGKEGEREEESDTEKATLLRIYDDCVELDVDLRLTVNEVKEMFLESCSTCLVPLGLQNNGPSTYSQSASNRNLVVFSTLDPYGHGYHPQMPLAGDAPIGDVIGRGVTILAWNGRSIGDSDLRPGMFGMPVCLKVSLILKFLYLLLSALQIYNSFYFTIVDFFWYVYLSGCMENSFCNS